VIAFVIEMCGRGDSNPHAFRHRDLNRPAYV
jgi:hypothetical protein